jgi:hypothetical protein
MSTTDKRPPIKLTSRDFDTIKRDLVNYAKIYYPDSYKDFNEASFGSLLFDMVAYIGDMLSFYIDYQANESYLDSAIEEENIVKLAQQLGYKFPGSSSSSGLCALYVEVPAQSDNAGSPPSAVSLPILKKGTVLTSDTGATFILMEDIDFSLPSPTVQRTVGTSDGQKPTSYAYKAYGKVVSGKVSTEIITVSAYEKFKEINLSGENITEIMTVVDVNGNEYYEVEYLSQNIIFEAIKNINQNTTQDAPYILRTRLVPRRFITQYQPSGVTKLQFGYGSEDSLAADEFPDPSNVILQKYAKNYFTDKTFDPNNLLKTDKFGIVPPPGNLYITYRQNTADNVNVPINSITTVSSPIVAYKNSDVPQAVKNMVSTTLECNNEEQVTGQVEMPTIEDIRTRALDAFATQNRAVTANDYLSLVYRMSPQFGAIKRANIVQDKDSFKRNLNLYVISENAEGHLTESPAAVKDNLKRWLNHYRMVNDSIDILDGRIVNIGIEFSVIVKLGYDTTTILNKAIGKITSNYSNKLYMGKAFYISDIYKLLNDIPEIVDTRDVVIVNKTGSPWSNLSFDMTSYLSPDGRFLYVPEDVNLEIRFPNVDIVGVAV